MFYTNEIVFRSHPDKVADQISDALLDEYLSQDPYSRCGIETVGGKGKIFITGEVTSTANVDVESTVKRVLEDVGYSTDYEIISNIGVQSPDIAQGVDVGGAGDQGMMFGYACRDTHNNVPLAMYILQSLSMYYDFLRAGDSRFLPDGKAQITGCYDESGRLRYIKDFVISYQNTEVEREETDQILIDYCRNLCHQYYISIENFHINPTGKFLIGGFDGDAGLTGRKIVVDNYHSFAPVGGGAFCVDKDTEFLTPDGFKKISEYNGELVAQWNDGKAEFVHPFAYIKTYAEKMYHIKSKNGLDMVLSENHDMVIRTSKGNIIKKPVKLLLDDDGQIKSGNHGFIPVSFTFKNNSTRVNLTDDEIRLQVAFCADGTLSGNPLPRVRLLKARKINRLRSLLISTNTEYRENVYADGYTYFSFNPPVHTKKLSNCLKSANYEQMKIIAEEVQQWDGADGVYRTTHKEEADFIQFVFASVYGTHISISFDNRIGEEYSEKYIRKSICYEVRINKYKEIGFRSGSTVAALKCEEYKSLDGLMYCFTVPSGILILRRNNRIFVTGNCGKDPTKVDRSGAYKARQLAIRYLDNHPECYWAQVQLSYAIGIAEPMAIYIKTDKGEVKNNLDHLYEECKPANIIKDLDLRNVKYYETAKYGHFGICGFPWEK